MEETAKQTIAMYQRKALRQKNALTEACTKIHNQKTVIKNLARMRDDFEKFTIYIKGVLDVYGFEIPEHLLDIICEHFEKDNELRKRNSLF